MYEFLLTTRDYTQNGPYDFVMLEHRQHDLAFVDNHYGSQDRRVVTQTSAGKHLDQFERPVLSILADDLPISFNFDDFNGRLVAELNPSGTLQSHFVWATQNHSPDLMIRYGVTYRFAKDHLGSIRAVIDTQTGKLRTKLITTSLASFYPTPTPATT